MEPKTGPISRQVIEQVQANTMKKNKYTELEKKLLSGLFMNQGSRKKPIHLGIVSAIVLFFILIFVISFKYLYE